MCQVFGRNQIKLKELVGAPFTYFTNYTSIARIHNTFAVVQMGLLIAHKNKQRWTNDLTKLITLTLNTLISFFFSNNVVFSF